jgi:hypothetical protein
MIEAARSMQEDRRVLFYVGALLCLAALVILAVNVVRIPQH